MNKTERLVIIGGGLAGCEAAWQAAERGIQVTIYEMRPQRNTEAHQSDRLAELVCSNSLGSKLIDRASGMLKQELNYLGSLLLTCAMSTEIPAGGALAVDRVKFAELVTSKISNHPLITVVREEVTEIPSACAIIASGPLTSSALADAIGRFTGEDYLYFYDAIAPVVTSESIDMGIVFRASRYQWNQPDGDYINCPLSKDEYDQFIAALVHAERAIVKHFELAVETGVRAGAKQFFEGCLPIEVLALRDHKAMAFGPMSPVGLKDPHTGKGSYAVVQLRQDDLAGSLYNMVGFQTNLTFPEQRRVFRMIPGLEHAEFSRYGQMHRNTFIGSPILLRSSLQYRGRQDLFFAGQITGVEGYMGNIATGWLAGVNAARYLKGLALLELPRTSMIGALCFSITHTAMRDFQPVKANYGLLGVAGYTRRRDKHERNLTYNLIGLQDLKIYLTENGHEFH